MQIPSRWSYRRVLVVLAVGCMMTFGLDRASAQDAPHTLRALKKLTLCELDRLFDPAPAGQIPVGYTRGQVLVMVDAKLPKLQACFASTIWRGKTFDADGSYINQWPGFEALRGQAELGVSWHDGKPCLVLGYPDGTPLFGNLRDELREIAPGLYLARLYDRCPCPRFRGYFAIQVACTCR
jgi:hypothetical protein